MAQSEATMETSAEIQRRFGDEQSNLLDQFERMSFQAHLSRAMLGRSLSEPGLCRLQPLLTHQVNQGCRHRRSRRAFHKLISKLFKPILRRHSKKENAPPSPPPPHLLHPHHPLFCKTFSTSMRF